MKAKETLQDVLGLQLMGWSKTTTKDGKFYAAILFKVSETSIVFDFGNSERVLVEDIPSGTKVEKALKVAITALK